MSTTVVHAKVWVAPRNQSGLRQLAAAVSTPSSKSYGKYLTADAYRAQFAPTSAAMDALQQWLKGAGLQVEGVGPDNHFLAVAGSRASIDAAFGTSLRGFTVNGSDVMAPTSAVTVPSSRWTYTRAVERTCGTKIAPRMLHAGCTTTLEGRLMR